MCRLRGNHIHKPLSHRTGYGMADGAVLAHLHLVLKHDLQIGAIVSERVWRPHQAIDLISFDDAGARIG